MKGGSLSNNKMWAPRSDAERLRLNAAQIRQLYEQAPSGVYGAALTVVVLTAALWTVTPRTLLLFWCGASLAVYLARQRLVAAFGVASPEDEATIRWGFWYAFGVWVSGILWSVAAFFLFPAESVLHQALQSLLVGGICAGTLAAYCPRKEVYLPFVTAVMLSLVGRYLYEGDLTHITMGVMAGVLLACFIFIGSRMHSTNTQSLKLRFEKESLLAKLTESEERYRQLVNAANDFIFSTGPDGRLTLVNPIALRFTGYSREEVLGKSYLDFVHPEHRNRVSKFYEAQVASKTRDTYLEYPTLTRQGSTLWLGQNTRLVLDKGRVVGFQGIARDITDRKRAEEAIAQAKREWEQTFDTVPDLIAILDGEGQILRLNRSLADRLNIHPREAVGKSCREWCLANDPPADCPLEQLMTDGKEHSIELVDGETDQAFLETLTPLFDHGRIVGCVCVARDITEQKRLEEWLRQQATHDALSHLPNHGHFLETFNSVMQSARRYGYSLSLSICDIDRFKQVNDFHGHQMGDKVIREMGHIMKQELRQSDLAGRYGGDEFVVACPYTSGQELNALMERIRRRLKQSRFGSHSARFSVTCSAGVAELTSQDMTANDLIREADKALYEAKRAGRDRIVVRYAGETS